MTPVYNQTLLLKTLLSKFVEILYINDAELEWMQDWILSAPSCEEPLSDDSEIYETLIYLRDLAQESNFRTIEELLAYFDDQQESLNKLVEPLMSDNSDGLSVSSIPWMLNVPFKTDSIRMLTGTAFLPPACTHRDIVHNLYQNLSKDISISKLENEYKELNFPTHCLKSINVFRDQPGRFRILPNSSHYYFKHYFENFSHPDRKYNKIISLIKKVRSWFTLPCMNDLRNLKTVLCLQRKEEKKIRSFYAKIFESIEAEQPIINDNFKTMVSRMMLTSKLNNPVFRKYIESLKHVLSDEKTHANIEESGFIAKKLYYRSLSEKKWSILKSPQGHSWITSDNPGVSIDITPLFTGAVHVEADPYWMGIDAKTMIYFPLSKQYCLRLLPPCGNTNITDSSNDNAVTFELSTEEELKTVNKLVFSSKPQVVVSEERGIQQLQCNNDCL